ncbi:hypothetical protein P154DRAFT_567993 [Amniculicola lignicola CBS 123094]|uniref:F-box domain-containing protein n=1 Tax=Amniculicola lignicola CBS 123094 TaxID=1392246 RepID=A0A6A5VXL9_9PLEO|nr:hypothetical protein P154DRAFT_567993 [Amniculicola lignicola CBS 123094]
MGTSNSPFRFLDLPKELRLMVYDRIPIITKHSTFTRSNYTEQVNSHHPLVYTFIIITQSISISILTTNHQIHSEASDIIAKKVADVLSKRPKIMVSIQNLANLWEYGGPLIPLHGYAFALRRNPAVQFATYIEEAIQSWTSVKYRTRNFLAYPYHRYHGSVVSNLEIVACMTKLSQKMAYGPGFVGNDMLHPLEIGVMLDDNDSLGAMVRKVAETANLKHDQFHNYKFSLGIRFLGLHRSDIVLDHVKSLLWDRIPKPKICKYYMASACDVVDEKEWDQDWAEGARF